MLVNVLFITFENLMDKNGEKICIRTTECFDFKKYKVLMTLGKLPKVSYTVKLRAK